jgi:hypothetical protein
VRAGGGWRVNVPGQDLVRSRPVSAVEDELRAQIADVMERYLRPLLPKWDYRFTLIARTDRPKANVVVTEDVVSAAAAVLAGEGLD